MKIAVLCDFDGTVARDDVGNLLFRRFAGNGKSMEIVRRWKAGEISSRECLENEVAIAQVDRNALDSFLNERPLGPYFKDFHDFACRRGMEVVIMSDGLDYYIEQLLVRNGLGQVVSQEASVEVLRDAIAGRLADTAMRERCRAFADAIDLDAGLSTAIDILEGLPQATNAPGT